MHSTLILIHICGAIVGLLAGFMAMAFRKGSGLHGAAGNVFFVSMLSMSAAGAYMAEFIKPNNGNVMGGVLTFYLVATGWVTARRRDRKVGVVDFGALLMALAIGAAGLTWGFQAASSPSGLKDGYPPGLYFVFGSIALLFAASDVRMVVRGGVVGAQRIARHLWRMCLALLFATFSFYPTRAHLFPRWLNDSNLLYVPHVLLVGAMLFWLVRVSVRKRVPKAQAIAVPRSDGIADRAAFSMNSPSSSVRDSAFDSHEIVPAAMLARTGRGAEMTLSTVDASQHNAGRSWGAAR